MRFWSFFILFSLAALLLVFPAAGYQQKSAEEKQMMEMLKKYGMPDKNHDFLKKYAGDWDVETKNWAQPGTEPAIGKATLKNQVIFDGRYVKCQFESVMMGQTFKGLEIIGYDLFQNKYVTFWIDSMSTNFYLTSGTLDASGKVLTETGTWPDPLTGKTQKVKNVTTFLEDGKYRFEMFMVMPDDKEFKSMELLATRKM